MKKEIKSYEELLKCDGMKFEGIYKEKYVFGIIYVESNGNVHFMLDEGCDVNLSVSIGTKSWLKSNFKNLKEIDFIYNIFVEVEEEWIPNLGEVVEVSSDGKIYEKRIFLFKHKEMFYCVNIQYEREFEKGECFRVGTWFFIKKIEDPKLEINIEEAKKIIAKNKGVNPENVTIKGL